MKISNELRVGIMFFTGLLLLVLLIATLTRWGQRRNSYVFTIRFAQAQGIQEGADVRVAGVKVGQVISVGLDPKTNAALVNVGVDRRVRLYTSYSYTIGIGGLVGERYVEIIPVRAGGRIVDAGDQLHGTTVADINELISNANTVVTKLSTTTDSINGILGDKEMQKNLRLAVADLQRTSASSAQFTALMNQLLRRNEGAIDLVIADLQDVAGDIRRVSDTLSPQMENTQIFANLELASANAVQLTNRLENISRTVDELLSDTSVTGGLRKAVVSLQQASVDLEQTMADAHDAMAVFPAVTANLEKASADLPAITGPIREIAPETSENILAISRRLRQASDTIGDVAQRVVKTGESLSSLDIEPEARLMAVTGGSHTRSDLNLDLHGKSRMLRLGIADVGQQNSLNIQFGNRLRQDQDLWFRYGIVQSSFGLGVDYQPNEDLRLSGELFDPGRLRGNALLDYRLRKIGPGWWASAGLYDVLDGGEFGAGITYRP